MNYIESIPPLNGGNYELWREKLELALALLDIDLAITDPCPIAPVDPVQEENESDDDFNARVRNHAPIKMKYDLYKVKWDQSNRKCLMVIKSSIMDTIRGAFPACTTATEYLSKVESHFTISSKAYACTIIERLLTDKYTGGGVREHILKMASMASKLKPMEMALPDEFLVYLIFASLPKEFEAFEINYNSQPDNWGIEKLIAMCVQEEERIKASRGDSINYVGIYKAHGKAPQNDHHLKNKEVDMNACYWCEKSGHHQKDCPSFLKHLINKGIPYEEDPSKRRKMH